jgi:hypothetical protein
MVLEWTWSEKEYDSIHFANDHIILTILMKPPSAAKSYTAMVSEFGLSSKYFIIHARRPQSHFHFSCRVPGLAGHLPMPSVDTLSPLISVSSSYVYKDSFLASHLLELLPRYTPL